MEEFLLSYSLGGQKRVSELLERKERTRRGGEVCLPVMDMQLSSLLTISNQWFVLFSFTLSFKATGRQTSKNCGFGPGLMVCASTPEAEAGGSL